MSRAGKIVVIGGTGLIGSKVAAKLRSAEYDVIPASPSSLVNAITGEGLDKALAGAASVIDASNIVCHNRDEVRTFFQVSSANLLAAEKRAGIAHHVVLSSVGADQLIANPYMQGKVEQEAIIRESSQPYTIVRATQFFEFIETLMDAYQSAEVIRLPAVDLQPIAADDVASSLVEVALSKPQNRIIDLAGPEKASFQTIVDRYAALSGDGRQTDIEAEATYFGARVTNRSLVPNGDYVAGPQTMVEWFRLRGDVAPGGLEYAGREVVQ